MRYIIESACRENNFTTIYYRFNLTDANKWSSFLRDTYDVDTTIYTEYDYAKAHPDYVRRVDDLYGNY